ncbi:MAG: hypothetical protein ACK58N_06345 [Synechocystis sp.]|jgi:hypothetical protein
MLYPQSGDHSSHAQSELKLALWQIQADNTTSPELYAWLVKSGLPHNVAILLHELISKTKRVGKKTINIGKIILIKIIDFVKAHPFLVSGIGIGATIGTAIITLITSIPLIGQLLSPIALALGITVTISGAIIGHNLDKRFSGITNDIIEISQHFFTLIVGVFKTIFTQPGFA